MAKIRSDLKGIVIVGGKKLVAGDRVPSGFVVGAHLIEAPETAEADEGDGAKAPETAEADEGDGAKAPKSAAPAAKTKQAAKSAK